MLRHAPPDWPAKTDTDIISMHCMWLPDFATYATRVLTVPDDDTQNDIRANWAAVPKAAATYKGVVYGYPHEYNTWALVYDHYLIKEKIDELSGTAKTFLQGVLNKLNVTKVPLSWYELKTAAKLLTEWNPPAGTPPVVLINQTGFAPFVEGMPEEQRFQFLSLLWSNGGDYVDLEVPTTLFDKDWNGTGVMDLYWELGGYKDPDTPPEDDYQAYDPADLPGYWYEAWTYPADLATQGYTEVHTVAMMILPTWMTAPRSAMGDYFFTNLGVAPIPIGPNGTESVSATYSWMMGVTEKAKQDERDDEAWALLDWLNAPNRPAGYINIPDVGPVPAESGISLMGDFLIYDSEIPSRLSDQDDTRLADFWFSGFMDIDTDYGRADQAFWKADEVQAEIGLMMEQIILTGAVTDPVTAVAAAADRIQPLLPISGDIDLNKAVNILDAGLLTFDAFTTAYTSPTPPLYLTPEWKESRGRSDIIEDNEIDVYDATILAGNFV